MKMSVCFIPFDLQKNLSSTSKINFRYTPKIFIPCAISKNYLMEIIEFTFIKHKFSVFGYNNKLDEFWGKKNKKNKCILHFTLNIYSINNELSNLVITPLTGDDLEFKNLLNDINNSLNLHEPILTL